MLPLLHIATHTVSDEFCNRFAQAASTAGTGKKKVDGTLAATRLGSASTIGWANERYRQTMLLVREFRMEWPNMTLLTADDVDAISSWLDAALYTATVNGHEADVYDMNPTCWAIWLVQNQCALKASGWEVSSENTQHTLSFESLYRWLEAQHSRGDNKNIYEPITRRLVKRYKLPFKQMTIPPPSALLFKYRKGALRLSEWMREAQSMLEERD